MSLSTCFNEMGSEKLRDLSMVIAELEGAPGLCNPAQLPSHLQGHALALNHADRCLALPAKALGPEMRGAPASRALPLATRGTEDQGKGQAGLAFFGQGQHFR